MFKAKINTEHADLTVESYGSDGAGVVGVEVEHADGRGAYAALSRRKTLELIAALYTAIGEPAPVQLPAPGSDAWWDTLKDRPVHSCTVAQLYKAFSLRRAYVARRA